MNFKGWKKVGEDHHTASFKHDNGSQLKIAKSALSKKHLGELGRLPLHKADGGDVQGGLDPIPTDDIPIEAMDQGLAPERASAQPPPPGPTPIAPQEEQQAPQMVQKRLAPEQHAAMEEQAANKEAFDSYQDRMNGHITPETQHSLFEKKSTLGKIGTLFGLLVAGAGSGITGQPNVVLEMMNKELDRDLDAQKQSATNKQNYWKIHQQNELNKSTIKQQGAETLGTLVDNKIKANTLAKNDMMLSATHKILTDLNMLPNNSPLKAQGLQKFGELQNAVQGQIQQNNKRMAEQLIGDPEGSFQKQQQGLRNAGQLGILPGAQNVAESNEGHHVPGFGEFSVAPPADVRQELIAKQEYDKAARKYIEFAEKHKGNWKNLDPKQRLEIARRGAVLGAELQGKYRLKTKGGVYKEGEQKYIESIIPSNATSWESSFNQIPKVEQTIQDNTADTQNLAKGYGGEAPKYYKGKYYMRGKNGEAVEVK